MVKNKTFEQKFPELKYGEIMPRSYFSENDKIYEDKLGAYCRDIEHHCLSKQRVLEAIHNIIDKWNFSVIDKSLLEEDLLKELEL